MLCRHGKKVTRFIVVTSVFTLFLLVLEELLFLTTHLSEHPVQQTEMGLYSPVVKVEKQAHLPNQVNKGKHTGEETSTEHTTNLSDLIKTTDRSKTKSSCPKPISPAKCKMYDNIIQHFTIKESDKGDDLINLHRTVLGLRVATVFVLGLPAAKKDKKNITATLGADHHQILQQKDILETLTRNVQEAKKFRDIVMGNFTDIYRNLTTKHVMAVGWVLSHCPKVKYIVKLDDDVIVNIYNLARHIKQTYKSARNTIVCRVPKNPHAQRKNASKWSVSMKEYPFPVYPPYCLGFAIFMTRDIAVRLYETTRDVRPFWIDDVYMTGLVAWKAGVTLKDFHGNLTVSYKNNYDKHHKNAMFVLARFKNKQTFRTYWSNLVAAES